MWKVISDTFERLERVASVVDTVRAVIAIVSLLAIGAIARLGWDEPSGVEVETAQVAEAEESREQYEPEPDYSHLAAEGWGDGTRD